MSQYRINIRNSRNYSGYFWDVENYRQTGKKENGYSSVDGGYAFTYWGAKLASKRAARKYLSFQPFEKIEELK